MTGKTEQKKHLDHILEQANTFASNSAILLKETYNMKTSTIKRLAEVIKYQRAPIMGRHQLLPKAQPHRRY